MLSVRPMLAKSAPLEDIDKYINDPSFCSQLKCDGQRVLVLVDNGNVTLLGRNGQNKTGISHKLLGEFEMFDQGEWAFDGELIGSDLWLFDLPVAEGHVTADTPFRERYRILKVLFEEVWKPSTVHLLPTAATAPQKRKMVAEAQAENREGIMFRHRDGIYRTGRSGHLIKLKFTSTVDAIITQVGLNGKDNVELAVLDPAGDRIVTIGQASAIGKKPKPAPLQVWEVKFLYVVDRENPRLVQPRLMSLRTDKALEECLFDQLDHAWTDKDISDRTRAEM